MVFTVLKQISQRNNTQYWNVEVPLHLLDGRQITLPFLLTIHGDNHSCRSGTGLFNDGHHFTDRCTGSDDIIDNGNPPCQRGADNVATLAMILGFLAIKAPGHTASVFFVQGYSSSGSQRDTFIGRPEEHVELKPGLDHCFRIKLPQLADGLTTTE